jgi:hypothetical protein
MTHRPAEGARRKLTYDQIVRRWEVAPNHRSIQGELRCWASLTTADRDLLLIGIALEEGDLPLIHQYGFAEFEAVAKDHRIINPAGAYHERDDEKSPGPATGHPWQGPSALGSGPAPGHTTAASAEAAARPSTRRGAGWTLGCSVEEDSRDLGVYFPQLSLILFDPHLQLFYREGWLQPLSQVGARFPVRLYYDDQEVRALPLVVVPNIRRDAPHMWSNVRNGVTFRSLCYTFAPDRTIVRGRSPADTAAEVLRQAVVWLLRYMVWCRFCFWPGADVGHSPEEIEANTKPHDPCPAHPWNLYGNCCRPKILTSIKPRPTAGIGINPARRIR